MWGYRKAMDVHTCVIIETKFGFCDDVTSSSARSTSCSSRAVLSSDFAFCCSFNCSTRVLSIRNLSRKTLVSSPYKWMS